MSTYRLYSLNHDGHVRSAPAILEAESDDDAIRIASDHATGAAMELWHFDKLVRTFPAETAARTTPFAPGAHP